MPRSAILVLAIFLTGCRCGPSSAKPAMVALVSVPAPGLRASEADRLIARRVEEAIATVPAATSVQTLTRSGLVTARVELDQTAAFSTLTRAVGPLKPRLPPEAEVPTIRVANPTREIIITNDRLGAAELRGLLERTLVPAWRRLPGVAGAKACGGDVRELHVRVPPERLNAYGLELDDILTAAKAGITDLHTVQVSTGPTGSAVQLRDLATIEAASVPDPCQCFGGAICAHVELIDPSVRLVDDMPRGTRAIEPRPTLAAVITHEDRGTLRATAQQVARWLTDQPGILETVILGDDSSAEIEVRHDKRCPAPPAALQKTVRAAQAGILVGETRDGWPVRIFLGEPLWNGGELSRLTVTLPDGNVVPLSHCAELVLSASPTALLRFNTRPALGLRAFLSDSARPAKIRAAAAVELPEGVVLQWVAIEDLLLRHRDLTESPSPRMLP